MLDDILKMFVNKDNPDLTAYGREERPIKCHKFIIKARCPKLYSEIVTETNSKGVKREVISLTCFSHLAVKAFIKFLYCGRLKADLPEKVIEEIEEVGKIYGLVVIDNKNSSATEKESNQMKIRKDEPKSQSKPLGLNDSRIIFDEPPKKNDCIQNLSSRRQSVDMFGDDDDIHFLQISTDSKSNFCCLFIDKKQLLHFTYIVIYILFLQTLGLGMLQNLQKQIKQAILFNRMKIKIQLMQKFVVTTDQ